ncbi:MAG TPA: hypothetical protein VGM78_13035, partial [Ilumatobacteraceae bacterium]
GVVVIAATTRPADLPLALAGSMSRTWVFHLLDPLDAVTIGVAATNVPAAIPGRLFDTRTRCEAQVFALDERELAADPATPIAPVGRRLTQLLTELPARLSTSALPPATVTATETGLSVGISFVSLAPATMAIGGGDHILAIGPARSGRTTALLAIAEAWQRAHPDGRVCCVAPRRSSARCGEVCSDASGVVEAATGASRSLIVIDDAELVDDPQGLLTALIADRREHITVVAAGRPDALRAAWGHWTSAVRRCRLGLVLAASTDIDADLLSASLPRRLPIPARPGLAWLVADGDARLIQVAMPAAS